MRRGEGLLIGSLDDSPATQESESDARRKRLNYKPKVEMVVDQAKC